MLHTVYRFREVTGHDHSTLITLIYFKSANNKNKYRENHRLKPSICIWNWLHKNMHCA